MTDAEFEAQQARIRALADRWVNAIGLGWWEIQLAYARDDYEAEPRHSDASVAMCKADWRYAHACITWNMPELPALSDEKLESIFVHELMHCFLHETRWCDGDDESSVDHEERVATTLAKGFVWLRNHVRDNVDMWKADGDRAGT